MDGYCAVCNTYYSDNADSITQCKEPSCKFSCSPSIVGFFGNEKDRNEWLREIVEPHKKKYEAQQLALSEVKNETLNLSKNGWKFWRSWQYTCPYCIRNFYKEDVLYVCDMCGEVVKSKKNKCNCGGYTSIRKCPMCPDGEFPKAIFESKNHLTISIAGTTGSGKSHYLTVMLHSLGEYLSIRPFEGRTANIQDNNFKVVRSSGQLAATSSDEQPKPQFWKSSPNSGKDFTLTIFDGAGEHSQWHTSRDIVQYLNASDALIVTIDPLTFHKISGGYGKGLTSASQRSGENIENENAAKALQFVTTLLENANEGHLRFPVAVILTKFDILLKDARYESGWTKRGMHESSNSLSKEGKIDINRIVDTSNEIEQFLKRFGEGNFVNTVRRFENVMFFGTSIYSTLPNSPSFVRAVEPYRVLDPVLWMFYKLGYLQ